MTAAHPSRPVTDRPILMPSWDETFKCVRGSMPHGFDDLIARNITTGVDMMLESHIRGEAQRLGATEIEKDAFLSWLVSMDDPGSPEGLESRRTANLAQIISRARELLGVPDGERQ